MRFSRATVIIALATIMLACNPYHASDLVGEWEAVGLTEEGDSIAVDLSEIQFSFTEDGHYTFQSTLAYKEAGSFRLDGPYLFTTDSLNGMPLEKAVEIQSLNGDTLSLLMKDMGKERLMVLLKQ